MIAVVVGNDAHHAVDTFTAHYEAALDVGSNAGKTLMSGMEHSRSLCVRSGLWWNC